MRDFCQSDIYMFFVYVFSITSYIILNSILIRDIVLKNKKYLKERDEWILRGFEIQSRWGYVSKEVDCDFPIYFWLTIIGVGLSFILIWP